MIYTWHQEILKKIPKNLFYGKCLNWRPKSYFGFSWIAFQLKCEHLVHVQKFLWSFGFLSWLPTYAFITNCGLNRHVYISVIVLDILGKLIRVSQNVCGCLALNEFSVPQMELPFIENLRIRSLISVSIVLLFCGSFF